MVRLTFTEAEFIVKALESGEAFARGQSFQALSDATTRAHASQDDDELMTLRRDHKRMQTELQAAIEVFEEWLRATPVPKPDPDSIVARTRDFVGQLRELYEL